MATTTVWIGTSWKMNKTIAEARDYVTRLMSAALPASVQTFVVPPHTALAAVRDCMPPDAPVLLGAQNAHWAAEGAWTGEISMRMAKDAGAQLVELGHSERREYFGETDETVALKARAAVDHGLVPLICVGEPLAVRETGRAEEFVAAQVRTATALLTPDEVRTVLVAYEPVWAIGSSGRSATPSEVAPVMSVLAHELAERSRGEGCRALLYGGGVDPGNAAGLLRDRHIEGLFVGRRAWDVTGLLELVEIGSACVDAARG
jgi:triosephosphate isomerase